MANVLIIDDDADARRLLSVFLEGAGHAVTCGTDGREGFGVLMSREIDVVVLDLRMPELDGMGLLRMIRSYLGWYGFPVIVLSTHVTRNDLDRAKALGVSHAFHKAKFALADLAAAIADVTGVRPRTARSN